MNITLSYMMWYYISMRSRCRSVSLLQLFWKVTFSSNLLRTLPQINWTQKQLNTRLLLWNLRIFFYFCFVRHRVPALCRRHALRRSDLKADVSPPCVCADVHTWRLPHSHTSARAHLYLSMQNHVEICWQIYVYMYVCMYIIYFI